MPPLNVVGPMVKQARLTKRPPMTQEALAMRLQLLGWDIDRFGVSKIERRTRCVMDQELLLLAQALDVSVAQLVGEQPLPAPHLSQVAAADVP